MKKVILSTLLAMSAWAVVYDQANAADIESVELKSNEIRIMSYNLENLFDTEHDQDKDDWDFVPINYPGKQKGCSEKSARYRQRCLENDWTQDKLNLKLNQIKKMVTARGQLPDILAVQEIENANVLSQLADKLGYTHYILEEGPDRRGIDVALLYNNEKIKYLNHRTRTLSGSDFENKPTRDVLAVYFNFPKAKNSDNVLVIYVNHWPSQAAPATKRHAVAKQVKKFMVADQRKFGDDYHGVVLGDFNTVPSDWPHPLKDVLLNTNWEKHLLDTQKLAKKYGYYKNPQPIGSYFFPPKMQWTFLDRMFVTQSLRDSKGMEVVLKSFRVLNPDWGTRDFEYNDAKKTLFKSKVTGIPVRYNHNATKAGKAGFSDHFPIEVTLRYR